jgi:hypothetical protein
MVTISDINAVLSGGATNTNPNLSLGGDPSGTPITDAVVNNLFDDVSADEAESGHEDYRCMYLFNDGVDDIFDARIFIVSQVVDGSFVELGIEERDEIQRITLSNGPVTGGTFELSYEGVSFVSAHDSDLGVWASDLQTTLRALESGGKLFFKDVTVTANSFGDTIVFDVTFPGQDGSRNHDQFVLEDDSLIPSSVDVVVSTPQQGSPINTIAPEIAVETTPPGGVGFFVPVEGAPILIPKLLADDGFPIWVKRVTTAETTPASDDGFTMRFSGKALEV